MKFKNLFFKLKMMGLGVVVLTLFTIAVMLLWNWLIPDIFGLSCIGFWQALGLLILSRILFGGFIKGGRHKHQKIHNRLREKWMNMSPEERKSFFEKRESFMSRHQPCDNWYWGKEDDEKPSQEDD